jgi:putative DNA primase/helicase
MDDLAEWVEDCCQLDLNSRESNKYLFASFKEWKHERAEKVPSIATWGERMRQQLRLEGYKIKSTRGFRGICLTPEEAARLNSRGLI